jgi:hypothetical protein
MASALIPAEWKKVLKDHKDAPDTAPLTKALEAYAKVEPSIDKEPQDVLDALVKVVEAAKDAKSANAKDKKRKPVVDFLDDVLKDAAKIKTRAEGYLKQKASGDGESDVGYDFTPFLKLMRMAPEDKALPFIFAPGKKVGGLVIARSISGKHKAIARELRNANTGRPVSGTTVIEGVCYGRATASGDDEEGDGEGDEDLKGRLIFKLDSKPKAGLAKGLMMTILKQRGKKYKVQVKGGGVEVDDDNDTEEMEDLGDAVEGEASGTATTETEPKEQTRTQAEEKPEHKAPPTPPKGPDPAQQAAFSEMIKRLSPRIRDALLAAGPDVETIKSLQAQAREFGTKSKFAEAIEALGKIEKLLDKSAEGAETEGAKFLKRVATLDPAVKDVLRQKLPAAKEIGLRFSEARALAQGNDFATANLRLDMIETLLREAGAPVSSGEPTQAKTGASDQVAEFKAKLAEWTPAIKKAIAAKGPNSAEIGKLMAQAIAL